MDIKANFEGVDELIKTLDQLPAAMQRKVYRKSLREGARIVRNKAVSNVRAVTSKKATGFLAKSIGVYNLKKRNGNFRVSVQLRKNRSHPRNNVRVGLYGSVLDYGKKNQAPTKWLRSAIKSESSIAVSKIVEIFKKNLNEAVEDAKK